METNHTFTIRITQPGTTTLIILLLFLLLTSNDKAAAQSSEDYSWHNVSIGGGGFVTGIIPSKTEEGLLYARTDVGGAYRWEQNTKSWTPLLDWVAEDQVGYLGVESLATDPLEPGRLYMLVGTSYFNNGKTAILRSDDYGETFQITDVTAQFKAHGNGMGRQSGEKLQVDPNKNNILFCGTRSNGLFKSTDYGASWNRIDALDVDTTPNGNGISFVLMDSTSASKGAPTQTIIIGVSRPKNDTQGHLYISNDGGASFSPVAGGTSSTSLMPHRADLASDGHLYVTYVDAAGPWDISSDTGGIWKYNINTQTWTDVSPATQPFGGISVDPDNPDRLVTSTVNIYNQQGDSWGDQIYITNDGGDNWTNTITNGFEKNNNGVSWISGHAIHWAGCITFDPFDTNKAWVISGNGIFQTDDIDATTNVWNFQVNNLEETVPLDIASIPNGPLVSVIGDYDGFRHTDVTTYAPIHEPQMGTTTGFAYAALNPDVMLRVGNEMYYSTDMGLSWSEASIKEGEQGSVATSADGEVFFHTPNNSSAYRSTDKGATWQLVSDIEFNGSKIVADPVNPNKLYAYNTNSGTLWVSTDKGLSFSESGAPGSDGSNIIRLAPGREGDVWVPLYGGGLTRSVDSGNSFEKINGVSYCGAVGFGKAAPGNNYPTVFIWGTIDGVLGLYMSIDEGASWTRINDDDHEYGGPANGQFVVGDMNAYGRVYMSTAGRGLIYGEYDQTCYPTKLKTLIKLDDETYDTTAIVPFSEGSTVTFNPQPASVGTWEWTGPDGFTSNDREITLESIGQAEAGIYTVKYTNESGCESAPQTFTIYDASIPVNQIEVYGQGNKSTIDTKGGKLQMIAEISPSNATDQSVTWSIETGNDLATIAPNGLLTAQEDGTVIVRATANDGSDVFGEADVTITNQNVTGIEDVEDIPYTIYPNPVTTEMYIDNASTIDVLEITNMNGKHVKFIHNTDKQVFLRLDDIPSGMYILEIHTDDKHHYRSKIIKR